jgi:hypothetical protein
MRRISGGCACGTARYVCDAEPLFAINCHCRDCQRESGGAFIPVLAVPKNSPALIQGTPRQFTVTADSGHPTIRVFCGDCGSPLYGLPSSAPDIVMIRAGSLDDPSSFRPTEDIYTAIAQPWDYMDPALPKAVRLSDRG